VTSSQEDAEVADRVRTSKEAEEAEEAELAAFLQDEGTPPLCMRVSDTTSSVS
jgi:hypothetical protein